MAGRQRETPIVVGAHRPDGAAVHDVQLARQRPPRPGLVVHAAERVAHVAVGELAVDGRQVLHVDFDVLVLGEPIQVSRKAAVQIQLEPPGVVEDQRVRVAEADAVPLAADLGGPEHVIEVGVVPLAEPAPVVALVFALQVDALVGGKIPSPD